MKKIISPKRTALVIIIAAAVFCMPNCSKKGDSNLEIQTATTSDASLETGETSIETPIETVTPVAENINLSIPMFPAPDEGQHCTSHKQCSPGSACIKDVCTSAVNATCTTDLDCPEFSRCFNGRCAACNTVQDCPTGLTCNEYGVCVPDNPSIQHCDSATDCENGSVCINGLCSAFCTSSSIECGLNNPCMSKNNMLVGICNKESQPNGYGCGEDGCQYYCYEGNDNNAYSLFTNGYCYPAGCKENAQCSEKDYCFKGKCISKECNSDNDCSRGKCKNFVCGCDTDTDCPENYSCLSGKCQKWECTTNEDCSSDKICDKHICMDCLSDADCKDNKKCLPNISYSGRSCLDGECTYSGKSESAALVCVECTENSHCPADKPMCDLFERTCYECFVNKDCKEGYQCNEHTCVKTTQKETKNKKKQTPKCSTNADCKKNEFCTYEQTCEKIAQKCTQDKDCKDGVKCNRHGYCTAKPKKVWGFVMPEVCSTDDHCARLGGAKCNPNPTSVWDQKTGQYIPGHQCEYLCTSTDDCEEGNSCVLGICVKDIQRHFCNANQDCPNGMQCNTFYHECIAEQAPTKPTSIQEAMQYVNKLQDYTATLKAPAECMHQSHCTDQQSCLVENKCGCVSNEQCGNAQRCNPEFKCECISDEGCQPGFVCHEDSSGFRSKTKCACTSDEVCGEGKLCDIENGNCTGDDDVLELYNHGKDYHYGYMHAVDLEKAIKFYTKSETLGNPLASIQLALIEYEKNKDSNAVKEKVQKALKQIDELQNNNKSSAQSSNLITSLVDGMIKSVMQKGPETNYLKAILMINGIGMPKNAEQGIKILKELVDKYYAMARYELIRQYVIGENIPKDINAARELVDISSYSISMQSGYAYLQIAKFMIKTPELFDDNDEQFIKALSLAAQGGVLEAEYQLSAFYHVNHLGHWDLDSKRDEIELLSHAAKYGHTAAAKRLELAKQWKEQEDNYTLNSEEQLEQEAQKGYAPACDKLRRNYQNGQQCAEELARQGLLVGDYLLMLQND